MLIILCCASLLALPAFHIPTPLHTHTPPRIHPPPHTHHTKTIRAYSNAREIIKEAVANETKEFIKENPQVCGKLTAAACQSFVRRTIVTQPDYKPLLRPTMPTLVDVLTAQLIKQGVFKSETWARAAAQRYAASV